MGNPPRYRRKGPYCVLSFLLLFCVFCGVISKSVLKSVLSIISAAGLRKKKTQTKKQTGQYSSREYYYKLTSGRSRELKL